MDVLKTLALFIGIHIPSIIWTGVALFITNEPWWAGWMMGYATLILILFPIVLIGLCYLFVREVL